MLFDSKLLMCDSVDLHAAALIGDHINLGDDGLNLDVGEIAYFTVVIDTALVGATSVTLAIHDCATEGGSFTSFQAFPAIAAADWIPGTIIKVPIGPGLLQWCQMYSTANSWSAGKITAGITK